MTTLYLIAQNCIRKGSGNVILFYLRKLSRFSGLFSYTALVIDTFYQRKGTLLRNIQNTNWLNYSVADRFLSIGWVPMS